MSPSTKAPATYASPSKIPETPTQRLDRLVHSTAAPLTGGLSPVSLALAMADWAWHLGVSPGRQMELAALATQLLRDTLQTQDGVADGAGAADDDPRFRHEAWATWPFSQVRAGFRNSEAFWREATRVPGMTAHHTDLAQFFARQLLGVMAPANWLATNPVVLRDVVASRGAHLVKGLQNLIADVTGVPTEDDLAQQKLFKVGRDVGVTPGQVVYRNRLIELIRYEPQTEKVYPEPVFIIPSWIMKFYILDLSPHNSMVRYLVGQGHTVYMLSWCNPAASDHDLTMDDYLRLGVLDALQAIGDLAEKPVPVHAMGYCLGGTLLAIAAAALAKAGPQGVMGHTDLPALKSLTLLAAQTDFSEPGELGLFIDESQIGFIDNVTTGKGYLSGNQMAGSFQFLHSRDLVWTRQMREYLMGEREQPSDLMAWNVDRTRMPARMHNEYLTALYLHNALAQGAYRVGGRHGRAVSLADLRMPVFLVGTVRDHVSPWRSVYRLHLLCEAEITFALASGGHNAGIVSEPGHAGRSYQIATRPAHGPWAAADEFERTAVRHGGSWWPAWQRWLATHSSRRKAARPLPRAASVGNAPGDYVLKCYGD